MRNKYIYILNIFWPDGKYTKRETVSPLEVDRILYDNLDNGCIVSVERKDNDNEE